MKKHVMASIKLRADYEKSQKLSTTQLEETRNSASPVQCSDTTTIPNNNNKSTASIFNLKPSLIKMSYNKPTTTISVKQSVEIMQSFNKIISQINQNNCSDYIQNFINLYKNSTLNSNENVVPETKSGQSVKDSKKIIIIEDKVISVDNAEIHTENKTRAHHFNNQPSVFKKDEIITKENQQQNLNNKKEVQAVNTKEINNSSKVDANIKMAVKNPVKSILRRRNSAPDILDKNNKDKAAPSILPTSNGHTYVNNSEEKGKSKVNQEQETAISNKVAEQNAKERYLFKKIEDILKNISDTNKKQNDMLTQLVNTNNKTSELCQIFLNKTAELGKGLLEASGEKRAEVEIESSSKKKHVKIQEPKEINKDNYKTPIRKHGQVQQASTQTQKEEYTSQPSAVKSTNRRKSLDERPKNIQNDRHQAPKRKLFESQASTQTQGNTSQHSSFKPNSRRKSLDERPKQAKNVRDQQAEYEILKTSTPLPKITLKRKSVDNVEAASIKKRRERQSCDAKKINVEYDSEDEFESTPKKNYTQKVKAEDEELQKRLKDLKARNSVSMGGLPPEYDKNDSRWTLRYRHKTSYVVELLKDSEIYIDRIKFAEILRCAKNDCRTLARLLLKEIFTENALVACCVPDTKREDNRPVLHKWAIVVICDYVNDKGKIGGWEAYDEKDIIKSMRYTMYHIKEKASKRNNMYS